MTPRCGGKWDAAVQFQVVQNTNNLTRLVSSRRQPEPDPHRHLCFALRSAIPPWWPSKNRSPVSSPILACRVPGDCRSSPPQATSDLLYGMALHLEKCDLLAFNQREVPPGQRLCRSSEHRWWHAARLSE